MCPLVLHLAPPLILLPQQTLLFQSSRRPLSKLSLPFPPLIVGNCTILTCDAFLNNSLQEEFFMSQPPNFIDPSQPQHISRLQQPLYGLKQMSHTWYDKLSSFLQSNGFHNSRVDASLFVHCSHGHMIYVIIYVDNFIITKSSNSIVQQSIVLVCTTFHYRDLGSLSFFLVLGMHWSPSFTLVSQRKYSTNLLSCFGMLDCKLANSPIAPRQQLSSNLDSS